MFCQRYICSTADSTTQELLGVCRKCTQTRPFLLEGNCRCSAADIASSSCQEPRRSTSSISRSRRRIELQRKGKSLSRSNGPSLIVDGALNFFSKSSVRFSNRPCGFICLRHIVRQNSKPLDARLANLLPIGGRFEQK